MKIRTFLIKIINILLITCVAFNMFSCSFTTGSSDGKGQGSGVVDNNDDDEEYSDIDNEVAFLKYQQTIEYANQISNKVSGYYKTLDKSVYHLENENIAIDYDLFGETKGITNIYNPKKKNSYVGNSFDTYIIQNGKKQYSSSSNVVGRENTYKLGYYYYNTHFMEQIFGGYKQIESGLSLLINDNITHTEDVKNLEFKSGVLNFDIASTHDPQIVFSTNYNAKDYNILHVRLKAENSTKFSIFMATATNGMCAEQMASATITGNKDFFDYYIILTQIPNYQGTIKKLRIDIGTTENEHIEIANYELLSADTSVYDFALDKSFHIYSDKLYEQDSIVAKENNSNLEGAGCELKIPKSTVEDYLLLDKDDISNTSSEKLSVGFKIANAGVFGIILPNDKKYTLSLTTDNDYYIVNINANITRKRYNKLDKFTFGWRIYTDTESDFSQFEHECILEHTPLEIELFKQSDGAVAVGYDSLRGCYGYTVNGSDFNKAYYTTPQQHIKINGKITSQVDRKIYVCGGCYKTGALENSVVLGENGLLLPIPTQNCKNFMGENEEPIFDNGDKYYSETFFPISLKANEGFKFSLIHLYQKWGQADLKQLSSIQFFTEYYHLSTGVTETNCIAMEVDNYLPDFRSMSAELWDSQPQHTSFGINALTKYTDSDGELQKTIHIDDKIISSGPTYAQVELNYITTDGKINCTYNHLEMPQTDENRTYYEIDYEFLDTLTINDFEKDFSILSFNSFNSTSKAYMSFGYLDSNNQAKIVTKSSMTEDFNDTYILGNNYPYFDMYNCVNSNDYVNFGVLIKDYDITIGNQKTTTNFVVRSNYSSTSKTNLVELSLGLGKTTFNKGDRIHLVMVLVPWGDQNTTNDNNIRALRQNTLINPFKYYVEKGSIISNSFLDKICVDETSQTAIFSISGGANIISTHICGFNKLGRLYIEEKINNEWVKYNNNYYSYDGYMVYYDEDKTFSYSFVVDMGSDNNNVRTFRVSVV